MASSSTVAEQPPTSLRISGLTGIGASTPDSSRRRSRGLINSGSERRFSDPRVRVSSAIPDELVDALELFLSIEIQNW
jgi:hypothetical protein